MSILITQKRKPEIDYPISIDGNVTKIQRLRCSDLDVPLSDLLFDFSCMATVEVHIMHDQIIKGTNVKT